MKGNTARHKSALKRARQNIKKRARNNLIRTSLRTAIKKMRTLAEEKKQEEVGESLKLVIPMIDKAVSKGVLPRNTGSRKIARLTKLYNKLS
ncbi:MAG: 30S ribosomal protein S20 [Nitrospinota bacterium]